MRIVADDSTMIVVSVNGVEAPAFPVLDEKGGHLRQDSAFLYKTQGE